MLVATALVVLVTGMFAFLSQGGGSSALEVLVGVLLIVGFIGLGFAYHWYFLEKFQATPGKMALGLIVVRSDGAKLSRGRIIGRFFAEIVTRMIPFSIGYIIAGFDNPQKRALHDHMCDTRVVKK